MLTRQIELIERSFEQIAPDAELVAAAFYWRLFELDPEIRALFTGDLDVQGRRMMTALGRVIGSLRDIDAVIDTARRHGARHVAYGVRTEHYETVGQALLDTLRAGLGDAFDDDLCHAWTNAYGLLSTAMLEGARAEALEAA